MLDFIRTIFVGKGAKNSKWKYSIGLKPYNLNHRLRCLRCLNVLKSLTVSLHTIWLIKRVRKTRPIKILRFGRPIYPDRLSKIGQRRAFTFKICTADHSLEHVCSATVDHRPTIGRQSGDILGVGRQYTDDRTTGYRQKDKKEEKYIYEHVNYKTT